MKYHKIYTVTAVFCLVVLTGFLCTVLFWPQPQSANALPISSPLPQKADTTEALTDNNALAAANFQAMETIPDEVYQESDSKRLLFAENNISESSIIEISPSDSARSSYSITSSPAADSSDTILGSSISSITGSSSSSITGDSGSSGSGSSSSSGSSGSGSSGSSGTSGSGSSDTSSSGSSDTSDSGSSGATAPSPGGGAAAPETVLEQLKKLDPLPKVHYSWYLRPEFLLDRDNEIRYQLARLTHSQCYDAWHATVEEVLSEGEIIFDNMVYACARINKTDPEIPCSIGINYSPWHRVFRPDLGTGPDLNVNYTIFGGASYNAEISEYVRRMTLVKKWIAQSNAKYETDVRVSAILLDSERLWRRDNDTYWNESMCEALDAIHIETAKLFPDARIEWYGRGQQKHNAIYRQTRYFTGKEIMTTVSFSCYNVPDTHYVTKVFQENAEYAKSFTPQIEEITPWVGLAIGNNPDYTEDWDYDTRYSYQMGNRLHETVFPYNRVKVVVFYPDPFNPETPAWGKHFVEYCKGAAAANSN